MKEMLGNRTAFWVITLTGISAGILTNFSPSIWIQVIYLFLSVLFLVSSVCRCHELNWSGWRVLAYPIPLVGMILLIELLFLPARGRLPAQNDGLLPIS